MYTSGRETNTIIYRIPTRRKRKGHIIDRDTIYIYTYNILPYIYTTTVYLYIIYIYIYTVQIRNLKIVLLTSNNIRKCYVCVLHIFVCFNRPIIDRDTKYIHTILVLVLLYIYTVYTVEIRNVKIVLLTSYIGSKCSVCVPHIFFVSIDLLLTEISIYYAYIITVYIYISF